jgi:acetylornithine deacetylase/succinyl-diaminopimelate desuccinylase-like protein
VCIKSRRWPLDRGALVVSDHSLGEAAAAHFAGPGLAALERYVTVPCLSPAFDPNWEQTGAIAEAASLIEQFAHSELGVTVERLTIPGRSPVLFLDLAATPGAESRATTLCYGHFDKQPPLGDWRDGLAPFRAVREGDRLYGRGSADDGYAAFAVVAALRALADADTPHGRILVLLEASEESGSIDLEPYLDLLAPRIGSLGLVICLDSGGATYDRLWMTTSLRGNLMATLRVRVLEYGVHSGIAGGIVPSSFRLARKLLSRIEDETTGEIRLRSTAIEVPAVRREELALAAELVGETVAGEFPTLPGLVLSGATPAQRILRSNWSASLAVIGAAGLPSIPDAGNVLRPETALRLSLRLPPTADAATVARELTEMLTSDPPQGCTVELEIEPPASGWSAPVLEPWLNHVVTKASSAHFGAPPAAIGIGGTIPFLASLARRYPQTQFLVTGVLGPDSNAHGPNESLHVPTAEAITATVAEVLAATP